MARSYRSLTPRSAPAPSQKPQILVPLTALGAGLINLVGGGVALKAWIFNAGQTYYEALFRGFWLPPGAIQLSDATITAAGYEVLRDSSELWFLGLVLALPAALLAVLALYPVVSLAAYLLNKSTFVGRMSANTKAKFGRFYLLAVGVVVIAWICGLLYVGLYQFPRAARSAGEQKQVWFQAQMASNCARCPEWGKEQIRGVAIASDGKQTLIATMNGVKALRQEGLSQTWPSKKGKP